ncbi:MAG: UDP-N-acetylmuramoyl-L-alanine--D-glutamate ligase [Clostridia bacterium]|nr:UDP-N-acetylmuramoyl-L-alanine--D-glutamate ligase [Clostridia bacterium]
MTRETLFEHFRGKRCSVIGLGKSNDAVIAFLYAHGARIVARDAKERASLGVAADRMESLGIDLRCGKGYLDGLDEEILFRAPGVPPWLPEIEAAVARGAILTSEIELFLELTPARVIGITGSDGKTTTTTLTGLMLEAECRRTGRGRVFVGGNIGTPLLPLVESMTAEDFAVLELSSFQLQTATRSVERGAITNVTPNHLNWHTDMAQYTNAKCNIYRHGQNKLLVTNAENGVTAALAKAHPGPLTLFSSRAEDPTLLLRKPGDTAVYRRDGWVYLHNGEGEMPMLEISQIRLPGVHNLENYMTAIALTQGLVSRESIREVARTFGGVRHRLEQVAVIGGVTYYNSSIDSSPTRTAAALSALAPQKPVVICGGYDKKTPYEPLAKALCNHAKAVVLTGASAPLIRPALEACAPVRQGHLPVWDAPLFADAVRLARDLAKPGEAVLLSPACASFDAFRNFEERGDTFCRMVREFAAEEEQTKGEETE